MVIPRVMVLALSLVSGPTPRIAGIIGCAALLPLVSRRTLARWWLWPVLVLGPFVAVVVAKPFVPLPADFGTHFPMSFSLWVSLPITAAAIIATFWTSVTWWRRVVALVSVPFLVIFGLLQINAFYDYIPTLAALLGRPVPGQISTQVLAQHVPVFHPVGVTRFPVATHHLAAAHRPAFVTTGLAHRPGFVVQLDIPATVSGFPHRKAWVWLPPAWLTGTRSLPVLVLIAGSPGNPGDWLRSGNVDAVANQWAATHDGVAPIMVMPDVNGAITADTECVDTARARPETYVTVDVRDYVISHFGASTNAGMWAVAGLSEGGTCAIDLALRHPNVFGGFEDLSGAIAPYVDSLKTARWELFGGSKSRQRHYDPQWLLRRHRCGFAWFDAGSQDRTDITTERLLAKDARRAGLDTVFRIQPGGHTYWVFRPAFADAYPWIVGHLTPHVYCASRANV